MMKIEDLIEILEQQTTEQKKRSKQTQQGSLQKDEGNRKFPYSRGRFSMAGLPGRNATFC
jgi:hypothetical protein